MPKFSHKVKKKEDFWTFHGILSIKFLVLLRGFLFCNWNYIKSVVSFHDARNTIGDPLFQYFTGPPRVIIQPSRTVYAVVGQRITLECIGQGSPTPSVYWRYDSAPNRGDLPINLPQGAGSATLTIESVANTDSGNYVCVATNNVGTTENTAQIIGNHVVQFYSVFEWDELLTDSWYIKCTNLWVLVVAVNDENPNVPGVTIEGPQTMSVTEGQSVTLRCDTTGKKGPFHSIIWFHTCIHQHVLILHKNPSMIKYCVLKFSFKWILTIEG